MALTTDVHVVLPLADRSQVGQARRLASALAARVGMNEADAGRVSLVVTEAASNVVKHAGSGELLVRDARELSDPPGVEVLALDRGPGMPDVERCLRDGYSTAGSPGTGLGAIVRLASSVDVYSAPGRGTALLVRVLPHGATPRAREPLLEVGAVRVSAPGESECGDGWCLEQAGGRAVLMLADGLGHGAGAARAAAVALATLGSHGSLPAARLLETAHLALRPTRGAAVSVAELDAAGGVLHFAGLGNVSAAIVWPAGSRSLVGQNGTAGGDARTVRPSSYPWPRGAALLMHSDGLTSHVGLQGYPGLFARSPSLVAGVLYRDFARGRDDATIVFAREHAEAP